MINFWAEYSWVKVASNCFPLFLLRCIFFTTQVGCKKGDKCVFCHHSMTNAFLETGRKRPKKMERDHLREDISKLVQKLPTEEHHTAVHQLQMIAQRNKFARTTCIHKARSGIAGKPNEISSSRWLFIEGDWGFSVWPRNCLQTLKYLHVQFGQTQIAQLVVNRFWGEALLPGSNTGRRT